MDSREQRAARRRELDAILDRFEAEGGDELAVMLVQARRLDGGLTAYGPLDVRDGRRWRREAGEELVDAGVYGACELVADERALEELPIATAGVSTTACPCCESAGAFDHIVEEPREP